MFFETLYILFSDPQTYLSLFSLAALLIVLDMDNVIFISILTSNLPVNQQPKARKIGLVIGVAIRATLLLFVGYLTQFKEPLFMFLGQGISPKNLIIILGGLFLIYKATSEIHRKLEGDNEQTPNLDTFGQVLVQITILDIIFSVDAVITAVGMVEKIPIMLMAMIISVLLMFVFQKAISEFVHKHPTMKILALSFLILIGVFLLVEGLHLEVPKGYIYFAMAFSFAVELLNMRYRSKSEAVKLRGINLPK